MVTIIPIDLSDDFVRDALRLAAADQLDRFTEAARNVVAELRGGIIEREKWEQLRALAGDLAQLDAVLEHARAFVDQHVSTEEDDDAEG